jgi:hypothetical protein
MSFCQKKGLPCESFYLLARKAKKTLLFLGVKRYKRIGRGVFLAFLLLLFDGPAFFPPSPESGFHSGPSVGRWEFYMKEEDKKHV